jgi:glycosyltransferase involved in cell wall biosynthesis
LQGDPGEDRARSPEAQKAGDQALPHIKAVTKERIVSTPVLHVLQGADARTRHYLSRLLPALARAPVSHPGAVATPKEPLLERQASRAGLEVQRLPARLDGWLTRRRTVGACRRAGIASGARLVHAHGLDSVELAAAAASKLRVPLVVSAYLRADEPPSLPAKVKRQVTRAVVPLLAFREGVRAALEAPVTVVPWGLDRRDLDGDHAPQRVMVELGLDPMTLHLGMAGDLSTAECGGDVFVDAAAAALKRIPFCDYAIIGTGAYAEVLQRRAHRLGILGRFRFVPYSRTLPRALTALNLITFPGRPRHFPWEVAEAAACRVPIVAADCPEHREILGDESAGVTWIKPGDVDGLASEFLRVLSSTGEPDPEWNWLMITRPDGAEQAVQARPSLTGVDISEGDLEEYDIVPDQYSKRRVSVLSRYSFRDAVAELSDVYRQVSGDAP